MTISARSALGLLVALSVSACAPPSYERGAIALRNPTAPIGGSSRFEVARFAGDWHTVACLGTCAQKANYQQATDGVYLRRADGREAAFTVSAPGVLRGMGRAETLVVMWIDEGFRTAAVGDADGAWAAIIARSPRGGADRVAAAREVLDFYGWDVSQLERSE